MSNSSKQKLYAEFLVFATLGLGLLKSQLTCLQL